MRVDTDRQCVYICRRKWSHTALPLSLPSHSFPLPPPLPWWGQWHPAPWTGCSTTVSVDSAMTPVMNRPWCSPPVSWLHFFYFFCSSFLSFLLISYFFFLFSFGLFDLSVLLFFVFLFWFFKFFLLLSVWSFCLAFFFFFPFVLFVCLFVFITAGGGICDGPVLQPPEISIKCGLKSWMICEERRTCMNIYGILCQNSGLWKDGLLSRIPLLL